MIISIMQSGYLPYCGFFDLIHRCDLFVIYDDVQYDKGSWRNRNRILGPNGFVWLTVPVLVKGRTGQLLGDTEINNTVEWRRKHLRTIEQYYSRAPHFEDYRDFFNDLYGRPWSLLVDVNEALIDFFRRQLGITCPLIKSSTLQSQGQKTERIIKICKELGATTYISSNGAKPYLQEHLFAESNLELQYQDYSPRPYPQLHPGFEPYLSVLDLLFNCGPQSRDYFASQDRTP